MTDTWKNLQAFEHRSYQSDYARTGTYLGHFSVPEFKATSTIRSILQTYRLCLDADCGILPMSELVRKYPVYLFEARR